VATSVINEMPSSTDLQRVSCVQLLRSDCVEYFSLVHFKPRLLLVISFTFSSPTHLYIIHAHAGQYKYNFMKMLIYMAQIYNNILPDFHSSIFHTGLHCTLMFGVGFGNVYHVI